MDGFAVGDDNGFSFHIRSEGLPSSWILMGSHRIVKIFSNGSLLTNIREVNIYMNLCGNKGVSRTNLNGGIQGYRKPIWYNSKGIANILSMTRVKNPNHEWEGKMFHST